MVAMAVACPPSLACRHRLAALPIGNLHSPDPISHNPSALFNFSSRSRASSSIASCWRSNPSCGLSELKRQLFTGAVERKKRMIGHERMRMRMRIDGKVAQEAEVVRAMEDEQMQSERPATLLREGEGTEGVDAAGGGAGAMRARYEGMIRRAQDEICAAVEGIDGGQFREDVWTRAGGGGGISRVLQNGNVWEKAGVNVSVVYGTMPPEAYRAATGSGSGTSAIPVNKAGRIPFFAAGISSVMHPRNPFAPTVHFNYRYFETDAPEGVDGAPRSWWFGGGTDLTPSYIIEEDVSHFHKIQKQACDQFDPEYYPKFKKWCDNYFLIKHRGERRGLGGIFFDDLNDRDPADLFAFSTECASSVVPAYMPIIEKRKDTPFTQAHKDWQQLRRGRYVEFNLVYDRGTTFGLKTGGRIESILMSLPLTARWEYDHHPEEGTEEWKLLDACKVPKDWV